MRNQEMNREFFGSLAPFAVKKRFIINSILIIIFNISQLFVYGQSEKLSDNITEIASDDSDPEAVTTFIDWLQELSEDPVKVNSSSEDEISRLFFLSDFQVKALADYTHSTGQIVSVYEIASIPGFDKETVEIMIPFITLEYKLVNNSDSAQWRSSLISNFTLKSGKNDTSYLGSAWRILTKYKFTSGGFSGGFTMEKDPGEKLFTGNP